MSTTCDRVVERLWFCHRLAFLLPGYSYTKRVINVAIASVAEDIMPVSKVPRRLERDFVIRPSESAVRSWLAHAGRKGLEDTEKSLLTDAFSGVLCVAEAYSGKLLCKFRSKLTLELFDQIKGVTTRAGGIVWSNAAERCARNFNNFWKVRYRIRPQEHLEDFLRVELV